MNDEPTLQTIAQQLESGFMQTRAELRAFKIEVLALAAKTRREGQSRSSDDERQRARFHGLEASVDRLEGRVDALEDRVDRLEDRIARLEGGGVRKRGQQQSRSDDDAPGER
jgi:predicted nuclease with TOPRIM domain